MRAPSQVIAPHIPEPYEPREQVDDIELDIQVCEKAAVDGFDRGPATIWVLYTGIKLPLESPQGTERLSAFVLEFGSDNPFVQQWATRLFLNVTSGNVTHSLVPQPSPSWMTQVDATITVDGAPVYQLEAFPYTDPRTTQDHFRWYYGPDPRTDFWEVIHVYTASRGDGPGKIDASPNSKLAMIGNGVGQWATITAWEKDDYRIIRPFSD